MKSLMRSAFCLRRISRMDSDRTKWLIAGGALTLALVVAYYAFAGTNDAAMLESGKREQRLAAIQALETQATKDAAETLSKYIADADVEVARRVLVALGRMKEVAPLDLIKPALADPRAEIREGAVVAIGSRGLKGDPSTLRDVLVKDTDKSVKLAAASVLGDMRDWDAMESFASALTFPDEDFQVIAAHQMLRIAGVQHQGFRPGASEQDRRAGINFLRTNWRYFKGTHDQDLLDKGLTGR